MGGRGAALSAPQRRLKSRLAETVRQVQAFQLVRASGGKEATPAGWEPGKVTLKPGPDLVGKVWEVWNPSME